MGKPIKIYCDHCESHEPLRIDPMTDDELSGGAIWGDLTCGTCYLVIATITVPEHGVYEFSKVAEL